MMSASTASGIADSCLSRYFLILDCTLANWTSMENQSTFFILIDQLCIFLNTYLASNHDNQLILLGADTLESRYLFPSTNTTHELNKPKKENGVELPPKTSNESLPTSTEPSPPTQVKENNAYQPFYQMNHLFISRLKQFLTPTTLDDNQPNGGNSKKFSSAHFSSALSKMLTYANRVIKQSAEPIPTHCLILSASPDCSERYVSLMNCIFSAQKLSIPIDVCQFHRESSFLQQAAHLTGGIYQTVSHIQGLIQLLLFTFLPPPSLRKQLRMPNPKRLDFRSTCFCHKKMVQIGYVCSVCLSKFPAPK